MKKAALYLTLLFLAITSQTFGQDVIRCQMEERTEIFKKTAPEYYQSLQEPINVESGSRQMMDIVTIPVHVIIVHPPGQAVGTGVNFPMDHIQSQIDVLNEDFRRLNADASNTPDVFDAADSEIEFCLAVVDPNGNDTDGVTRYGTTQNLNSNETAIKNATGWDRNDYLNIWVGPNLGGILGWAYLPSITNLPPSNLDGVVVASTTFGGPGYGTASPYDLGRTATHEVGHYLGLNHVWGGGGGGCGADDGFADTPNQSGSNFGCPNHPDPSCGNSGDMFMNYMDYVNDNCMNAFTEDQNAHMHAVLNNSRSSLLDAADTKCSAGGIPLFVELVTQTDALCFGENSGTVVVEASGGSGGYTYSIDGGDFQTENIFENLIAGPHVVTAQDSDGATISIDVVIGEPSELVPSIDSQIDVTCFGFNDGTILVSAFGGTPGPGNTYQYSIDGGGFSPLNVFENLSAGSHLIIVQDDNGCETQIDGFIIEPAELISLPEEISNVTCNGESNGLVSIITLGGTPGYSYSIDQVNYQPEPIFIDLSSGDYILTTFDQNGCLAETPFEIEEPEVLELSITDQQNVLCFGETNGAVVLEANGGTVDYQYSVDGVNYQSNPSFDNLSPGTISISVLDANDCFSGIETTITAPEELVLELLDQTDAGCAGQEEGTLTFNALGGSGDHVFIYQTDTLYGDTVTFMELPAGAHTIMVYDVNDCNSELLVEIEESAAIELETIALEEVSCFESTDGLIEVLGNGGSGDYQYAINGGDYGPENIFNNLAPGDYTINVQDESGCEGTTFIALIAPEEINAVVENQNDPNCFGDDNGSVTVLANGGVGNFEYTLGTETNLTGEFSSLSTGTYDVIAADANGCFQVLTIDIIEPTEVNLEETANESSTCFGDDNASISLNATGGDTSFEYTLNGETNTTGDFESLPAGIYTAMVTDGNGCTQTLEVTLSEPEVLEVSIDYVSDVSCAGDASGAIQIESTGGSGSVTYTLNGETNNTGLFEGLEEGDYTIDALDTNGCSADISAAVASSDELSIAEDEQGPVSCFGENDGFIQLIVSGGNGDFEFELDGNNNTTGLFENLSPGVYSAIVSDNSGCSGTYDFEITEPVVLEIFIDESADEICFGDGNGMLQISGLGGTGNYTFNNGTETNATGIFDNLSGGDYEILVTDESACTAMIFTSIEGATEIEANISNEEDVACNEEDSGSFTVNASGGAGAFEYTSNGETNTTGVFENLSAGNYPILIVDENGCETSLSADIQETAAIELEVTETNMNNCFGATDGTIQVEATGGEGDLEYNLGTETNTTGYFENLPAGDYEIEVIDASGCSNTILQSISQPAIIESEITDNQNPSCFGETGMVEIFAQGGSGILEYTLNGETNTTGVFENLMAGDYEVQILDENGCDDIQLISITEPDELSTEIINQTNVECDGSGVGAIEVLASGGNGNIEYTLGTETNTTGIFNDLPAGDYEIQITDGNDCSTLQAFNIAGAGDLEIAVEATQMINCFGEMTGAIEIIADGGSGNYEYILDGNVNTTGVFENLAGGIYEVSVVDQDGCTDVLEYEITQPGNIESEITDNQNPSCFGETGMVEVFAQGGSGILEYTLNGETNTTGVFENLMAGDYEVQVLDENGCDDIQLISITEPDELSTEIINQTNVECDGSGVGAIEVLASGGNGNIEYTLGTETNSTGVFNDLPAGDYEIQITDGNDCSTLQAFNIAGAGDLEIAVEATQTINCFGEMTGAIEIIADGGSGNYEYILDGNMNTTGVFENLAGGIYEVSVVDQDGCTDVLEYEITQPSEMLIDALEINAVTCFGESNGSLNVSVTGGDGNYTYTLNSETNNSGLFLGLAANTYQLMITDGNGCTSTAPLTIEEPQELSADVIENTALTCYGAEDGLIQVAGLGGTGGFTYTIGLETNTTGTFENLPGGIYTLQLADDNGCSSTLDITVEQPEALSSEILNLQSIGCSGNVFGAVQVLTIGGTGTIEYNLGIETNTTGVFENLNAGDYNISATDQNGCNTSIEFSIIQSGDLEAAVAMNTPVSCFGGNNGSIQVEVNGSGSYIYTLGSETNNDGVFNNLPAGDYSVEVADGSGCNTSVEFSINQPNAIIGEAFELSPLTCFGASDALIQVEAFGGNGPYTFTLNNETNTTGGFENLSAGMYEVLIADQNNCTNSLDIFIIEPDAIQSEIAQSQSPLCNGDEDGLIQVEAQGGTAPYSYSLGGMTNSDGLFENLPAGNYQVLITDDNGCTSTDSYSLTQPDHLISGVLNVTTVQCFGGSDGIIFAGADGGTAPYQFELDGETNNGGVFFNLPAGEHIIIVTDVNGCTSEMVGVVSEFPELILETTNIQDDTGTGNGSVSLQAMGGVSPYEYSMDGNSYGANGTFTDLPIGTYTAYVRDANGCITEITFTVDMGTFISDPEQGINDIQLFPNPFAEDLHLKVDLTIAQDIQIRMFTIHGQALYVYKNNFSSGTTNLRLDLPNNLPAGTYIFSIQNEDGQLGHYKLVKQ